MQKAQGQFWAAHITVSNQECGFSSQDVTITFVLLNLLLSAQLIYSFMT